MSMGWCCPHPPAPLSRKAGEGDYASAHAEADASALQTGQRAPLHPSPTQWERGATRFPSPALRELIPIARPKFTNCCTCRIPPLPALSPLVTGGEGRGEGGFEADGFINSGSAIGIRG